MDNPKDFYARGKAIGKWQGRIEAIMCALALAGMAGGYVTFDAYRTQTAYYAISVPRENTVFVADSETMQRINMATQDTFPMAYEAKKGR